MDCPTPTFEVEGHHFALIVISGLQAGRSYPYQVTLNGRTVWPMDASSRPSTIRTRQPGAPLRLSFGSCRIAGPHDAAANSTSRKSERGRGLDTLRALALKLAQVSPETWPDALLFLGDQVYADDVSPETAEFIRHRRPPKSEPVAQVADFEEYTRLYRESWTSPEIRWLLSTVPSAMIFDDHDIHDDWNTSEAWRQKMWALPWWKERIVGGLVSYWVYQHIGNLSPQELAEDARFRALSEPGDHGPELRQFALSADAQPEGVRWSYRRDWDGVRLVVVDSRSARVLTPGAREMLDPDEWDWLAEQFAEPCAHLLLATSLPYLLPHAIHDVEAWDEAICDGSWGPPGRWLGEKVRQAIDLEHWAAFQRSFARLTGLIRGAATGSTPPASIIALSGDIHYAYVAEATLLGDIETSTKIYQLVCSPLRNIIERRIVAVNRFATSRFGQWLGRSLVRTARVTPTIDWVVTDGPWFGNEMATLDFVERSAHFRIERATTTDAGDVLELVGSRALV